MPPRGPEAHRAAKNAQVAEQQIQCYELRLTGMSIEAIAKATGIARSTVHDRIQAEITGRVQPLAEEVRKMELDRLDRWLEKLNDQIAQGYQVARSIEVAIRVSERRAKLLGIDAPERVEATITEITQEDVALAEMVAEAKAMAANAEAKIREGL